MSALSFRRLVVGGIHICDSIVSPLASALRLREELKPGSKGKGGLVYRDVLDLASRPFKIYIVPLICR